MFGSLFDQPDGFDRDAFAERLARLSRERVFIGGSSWKYEGWIGQIYDRSRYLARGKFSRKAFEESCLSEYATVFPTVCGDFAFYQFPGEEFWRKLFSQVPAHFQFAFKVPEQITSKIFPVHARYGAQGGLENPTFLDVRLFQDVFLRPLEPYRKQTALLIFEFGAFSQRSFTNSDAFLDALDPFLAALPRDFRYAVEIRNAEFLGPGYFACLHAHNVAHVYNAWTRMPGLKEQVSIPGSGSADFLVTRALLRQGRAYEDAVRMFSPYSEVRDPNPDVRAGLGEIVQIARREKKTVFLFINNRLEGNAPGTIVSILEDL